MTDLTPGKNTSEYTVTSWMVMLGSAMEGIAGVLESIPGDHKWVQLALVIVGALVALASAFGYKQQRVALKMARLQLARDTDPMRGISAASAMNPPTSTARSGPES